MSILISFFCSTGQREFHIHFFQSNAVRYIFLNRFVLQNTYTFFFHFIEQLTRVKPIRSIIIPTYFICQSVFRRLNVIANK